MFKRDKKSAAKKSSEKEAKVSNVLLISTAVNLLSVWLMCGAIAAFLALYQLPLNNKQQLQTVSQAYADLQASVLDNKITFYQSQLRSIAKRSDVIAAVTSSDQTALDMLDQHLAGLYEHAVSIRLIPLGTLGIAQLEGEKFSLRNNIQIDMVRKASQNKKVPVETYSFEKQWLISIAQPILKVLSDESLAQPETEKSTKNNIEKEPQAKVLGAILLTLSPKFATQALGQLDPAKGLSTLTLASKTEKVITRAGIAGLDKLQQSKALNSAALMTKFAPSNNLVLSNSASPQTIWIAAAVGALLASLIILFRHRATAKAQENNLELLIDFGNSLKSKERLPMPGFTLSRFGEIADAMAQLRQLAGAEGQTGEAAAVSANANASVVDSADQLSTALVDEDTSLDLDDIDDLDGILDLDDVLDVSSIDIPVINEQIFRAYDIRGMSASDLNDDVVYQLGMSIGSEAFTQNQQEMVVGYDGRHSSPTIKEALKRGLIDSGMDVIDIGLVPTPLVYFATHHLNTQSGIMITGSHNPPEYNGLKIVIAGKTLAGPELQKLKRRIQTQDYQQGQGSSREEDVSDAYIDTVISDVAIAQPLKVVIDCGNGAAGDLAPRLIQELGCEVIPLFCDINGDFPNHHPDPSILENMTALIQAVQTQGADLGIAFDGDGDRLGVVSAQGNVILPDRLLMLFAQDVVSRNPGADVIFDVKCTRHLNGLISSYGGRPIMWKSGHSFIKEKMQETGALLGGELSGHIFFKERWYGFDDGIYSAARLIEILSTTDADLENQLSAFPDSISTAELHILVSEESKFELMSKLLSESQFNDAKISDLDGIRADFPDGWGLVRASNTTPKLTLRFEAESQDALDRIQNLFKEQLSAIDSSLDFPF